jgi:hypothetical protein
MSIRRIAANKLLVQPRPDGFTFQVKIPKFWIGKLVRNRINREVYLIPFNRMTDRNIPALTFRRVSACVWMLYIPLAPHASFLDTNHFATLKADRWNR